MTTIPPLSPPSPAEQKARFIQLLAATRRRGIKRVLEELGHLGFYEAPASTVFHLNHPGGLLTHSLNVYDMAVMLRRQMIRRIPALAAALPARSIAIAALLHDVCKAEVYKPSIRHRKNADGRWEDYQGYEVDYAAFPLGHGEKSVIRLLRWGLDLTDDEMFAIRWHMGAWELPFQSAEAKGNLNAARARCPLATIVSTADGLAAALLEG
ncbi:MAG: HD domain-containing protein [Kiritimatiellae bacterium]|nr:HD domain-containing protein [Kiritimatiellia bacterium]